MDTYNPIKDKIEDYFKILNNLLKIRIQKFTLKLTEKPIFKLLLRNLLIINSITKNMSAKTFPIVKIPSPKLLIIFLFYSFIKYH